MRAPLEHLESSTPMGAGEGAVYVLMAGALIGLGAVAGYIKATMSASNKDKELLREELVRQKRNARPHNQRQQRS